MKLKQVDIESYRSIRDRATLIVEPTVTVVLGPNDHGKTNLLNALQHLNEDQPFVDDDLNWDRSAVSANLPCVVGRFTLSEKERAWLLHRESNAREAINRRIAERARVDDQDGDLEEPGGELSTSAAATGPINAAVQSGTAVVSAVHPSAAPRIVPDDEGYEDEDNEDSYGEGLPPITTADLPVEIFLRRAGIETELTIEGLELFRAKVRDEFREFLPRIELIEPITRLSDSVTAEELGEGKNEFMRGIFYYAGLDPDASNSLFEQNDRTEMQVTKASARLNTTLRESWSQGKDLDFRLSHNSKDGRIELQIEDPSISTTYVRASRRSSGFTHYFSLKTILHARQKDHPAESYVLLFDEPGVFLHPSGQFDLLQVLETLSLESQVVYVTHSLFMINKTFPTRHRLIMKTAEGTTLDGKPYVGRWEAVLNALGLTLTGSILFANHVVLTEGDSDPIYIFAVIQKAVAAGKVSLDINSLSVMSTGESRHADVLLRVLREVQPKPHIAMLFDGDKGGESRLAYVSDFLKEHSIASKVLTKETAIEDHLPMLREIYVPAVAKYVAKLMVHEGKATPDAVELESTFLASFDEKYGRGKVTSHVAEWAESAAAEIGGIRKAPSKIGIAREYASLLMELESGEFKLESRSKGLIEWIHENAHVPEIRAVEKKVLDD